MEDLAHGGSGCSNNTHEDRAALIQRFVAVLQQRCFGGIHDLRQVAALNNDLWSWTSL